MCSYGNFHEVQKWKLVKSEKINLQGDLEQIKLKTSKLEYISILKWSSPKEIRALQTS